MTGLRALRCVLSCVASGLVVASCIDPRDDFNEFAERAREAGVFAASQDAGGEGGFDFDASGACARTEGTTREFLFSFSTVLDPPHPILFMGTVTIVDGGNAMDIEMVSLSAADRMTPVGPPVVFSGVAIREDGFFDTGTQTIKVLGAANAILADLEADVEVRLQGAQVCDDTEFACGIMDGLVLPPLDFSIDGSTFAVQQILDPANLPDPVINCDRDPAAPLGE